MGKLTVTGLDTLESKPKRVVLVCEVIEGVLFKESPSGEV